MEALLNRYSYDLPTKPLTGNRILVTGATGYIGGELVPELVGRGYEVTVMVRSFIPKYKKQWPAVNFVIADALNYPELEKALKGIDCAFYLIHSLHDADNFIELDLKAATNFRKASEVNNLKRIIYLGSLGNPAVTLSNHLSSRMEVAEALQKGKTPVTFLRAAIIIGIGSASYKILNNLVRNCPIFLFPSWANSNCQPIAIRDIIMYLIGSLENEATIGRTFDIGGQDILTYGQMLKLQAKVLNKRRVFIQSGFSGMKLYIKIASKLTPLSTDLIRALMASCVNNVICLNSDIRQLIPFQTLSYIESLERSLERASLEQQIQESVKPIFETPVPEKSKQLLKPPKPSTSIFSDVRHFLFHKPSIPTLIKFNTIAERENYHHRIAQRLDIEVTSYQILNIHKIGVNVPNKYVFEELLLWNGDSTCWPNYIAKVINKNNSLENLYIYLFGWTKFPQWIKNSFFGRNFIPLFALNATNIQRIPDTSESDNARFLLYSCTGGYPIGIFSLYVRSSIADQQELKQTQLFLTVGFNFYGREKWSKWNLLNNVWETIHNRVTSNVLNRIKQLCEWRFEKIQMGKNHQL